MAKEIGPKEQAMRDMREREYEARQNPVPPRKAPSKAVRGQHADKVIIDEMQNQPAKKARKPRKAKRDGEPQQ